MASRGLRIFQKGIKTHKGCCSVSENVKCEPTVPVRAGRRVERPKPSQKLTIIMSSAQVASNDVAFEFFLRDSEHTVKRLIFWSRCEGEVYRSRLFCNLWKEMWMPGRPNSAVLYECHQKTVQRLCFQLREGRFWQGRLYFDLGPAYPPTHYLKGVGGVSKATK